MRPKYTRCIRARDPIMARCGRPADGWMFQSIKHWKATVRTGSPLKPCIKCLVTPYNRGTAR